MLIKKEDYISAETVLMVRCMRDTFELDQPHKQKVKCK